MEMFIGGLISVLAIAFGLGAFYIGVKQKEELKEQLKEKENELEQAEKLSETYAKEKRENEELVQKMSSGDNLDSANASIELLQKQSNKGKQRNNQ